MKALSVKQPWASMIVRGEKTIETRTWRTNYRGPLLIVASKKPNLNNLPTGEALCIVRLIGCRRMQQSDCQAARCETYPGAIAWLLEDIKPIEPFPVKGQLGLYDVDMQDGEHRTGQMGLFEVKE